MRDMGTPLSPSSATPSPLDRADQPPSSANASAAGGVASVGETTLHAELTRLAASYRADARTALSAQGHAWCDGVARGCESAIRLVESLRAVLVAKRDAVAGDTEADYAGIDFAIRAIGGGS
jgi:hypothetical protein